MLRGRGANIHHPCNIILPLSCTALVITHSTITSPAGSIVVHVGTGNHVDMAQVATVRQAPAVHVVEHETFHHNVPAHLEGQGELVPMLKAEALHVLRTSMAQ